MKKTICLISILIFSSFCGPKQDVVEKIIEDGVEIVLNHLEPYKIEGNPSTLHLDYEFTLDTEDEELLDIGLIGIESFDVDSEGNIYLIQWQSQENYVYKFDSFGRFLKSFVRFGQGPGELAWGGMVLVNVQGEIMVKDPTRTEFLVFDRDGNLLREIQLGKTVSPLPLDNGNYLITWQEGDRNPEFYLDYVGLWDSNLEERKELDVLKWANPNVTRYEVNGNKLIHGMTFKEIFVGHSKRGYEIHVYDSSGNILRKIRKNYKPTKVSEEYKKTFFDRYPDNHPYRTNCYFTNNFPPFRYLFPDDEGRLYVMTYEESEKPGEFLYDIFNSEGIFVGRTKLDNVDNNRPTPVRAKNKRLYYLHVKESGYKEFIAYKMRWE